MISLVRFRMGRSSRYRRGGFAAWLDIFTPTDVWQPVGFLLLATLLGFGLARLPLSWGIIILVVGAILLLTVIQPFLGLGLTLLVAPLGALENILLGGALLNAGQILLLLTLAAWFARGLLRRRVHVPHTPFSLSLALFIYVALTTLLAAPDTAAGIKELLKWIEISLVMLMVVDLAAPTVSGSAKFGVPVKTWWILLLFLLPGLVQALLGIWQFGLRGSGPEHFLVLDRFYRAYGTFEQPNPFGGFVNLTAMLALGTQMGLIAWWTATGRRAALNDNRRPGRLFGIWLPWRWPAVAPAFYFILAFVSLSAVAASLALIFSWSRGAWLGFVAGAAVLILFWARNRWQGLAWFIAVVFVGGVVVISGIRLNLIPGEVVERISSFSQDLRFGDMRGVDINDSNYAVFERLAHWQAALDMARAHPWLGVGFGNYEAAYADYALINWPDALGHAHNYYLNIMAETGLLGLVAYLWLWIMVFWQTLRTMTALDWPGRGIPLGLLAAWTAVSVHHLVDKLYVNNNYIFLGVMFALLTLSSPKKLPEMARKHLNQR